MLKCSCSQCCSDGLRFFPIQLFANAVVHELSLYQASKWIAPIHPTLAVNATAHYLPSIFDFCDGPVADCADQIVITPYIQFGPKNWEPGTVEDFFCTIERIYMNAQISGAAAIVGYSEPYMKCAFQRNDASTWLIDT